MTRGVLLMAYGTPESPEQVEAYYTHIRGGRTPGAEAVQRLQRRYELVGGRTPLLAITTAVRDALERDLNARADEGRYRVYVGMKHWHPFIADVVPRIIADGATELVAVALAPHYSRISIGGYRRAVEEALAAQPGGVAPPLQFVDSWHLHPGFIALIADRIADALSQWPARRAEVVTVFSAHSLPQRIREWNDPYERQLLDSCRAVAERAGLDNWRFAWQSAGETSEPWLGPDICDVLETLHREGVRHVLSVPIGFVSDHLEILYDIDHEAKHRAESLGMTLRRTHMPNADPAFVRVLTSVVAEHASAALAT